MSDIIDKLGITPGPWKVDDQEVCSFVGTENFNKLFDVRGWGYFIGGLGLSEEKAFKTQLANANLIAAAPEMLEALIEWGIYAEKFGFIEGDENNPFAIIEKATGRTWEEIRRLFDE